jgi:hypothetical protein
VVDVGGGEEFAVEGRGDFFAEALGLDALEFLPVMEGAEAKNPGSYLLPAAFPEWNPQHPSYGEGHGVLAGACVTALKAFFDEPFVIPKPVVASGDGQSLSAYTGADAGQINGRRTK